MAQGRPAVRPADKVRRVGGRPRARPAPPSAPRAEIQRVNLLRLPHAAQGVAAERPEPGVAPGYRSEELRRNENGPPERLAQRFDPSSLVDGWANDGEV